MKKSFTLGAVSGIATVMVAVPLLAQVTGAQEATSSTSSTVSSIFNKIRAPFTQETIQEMIDRDTAFLANVDAAVSLQKSAVQTHKDALTGAAAITDETQRQAAVQAAHEAMRATIDAAITANPDLKSGMHMGFGKGGHDERHHGPGDFAVKLGMTPVELKTALESGKTIEQIAAEKGITLPVKIMRGMGHLADELGMTETELQTALSSGKTIEQLAEEKGFTLPTKGNFMFKIKSSDAVAE